MAGQQQGYCPLAETRTVLGNDEGILRGEKPRLCSQPKSLKPKRADYP